MILRLKIDAPPDRSGDFVGTPRFAGGQGTFAIGDPFGLDQTSTALFRPGPHEQSPSGAPIANAFKPMPPLTPVIRAAAFWIAAAV